MKGGQGKSSGMPCCLTCRPEHALCSSSAQRRNTRLLLAAYLFKCRRRKAQQDLQEKNWGSRQLMAGLSSTQK